MPISMLNYVFLCNLTLKSAF